MKRLLLAMSVLSLLPVGSTCGAEPTDEVERQIERALAELRDKQGSATDRRGAADRLGKVGQMLTHMAYQLGSSLHDPDEAVRLSAAKALQQMGPSAHPAIPNLLKALKDPSDDVRTEAASALAGVWAHCYSVDPFDPMGAKDAVAALTEALKDKSKKVRLRAAMVLGAFGPAAKPAVSALVEALHENDGWRLPGFKDGPSSRVCLAAAHALSQIGPAASEAIPVLLGLLKNGDDVALRRHAIAALAGIANQDERVVQALLAAAVDPNLRAAAVGSLGRAGPQRAKEVIPTLLKALDVSDIKDKVDADMVLFGAIQSLAELGPEARVAVPRIEAIFKDPNCGDHAYIAAKEALRRLRPPKPGEP